MRRCRLEYGQSCAAFQTLKKTRSLSVCIQLPHPAGTAASVCRRGCRIQSHLTASFFPLLVGERILQLAKQLDSGRLQTGNFSRLRSVLGFSVFPVEDRSRPPFLGTDAAHVRLCDEKSGAAATNFRRGCKAIPARLHKEIPVRLQRGSGAAANAERFLAQW